MQTVPPVDSISALGPEQPVLPPGPQPVSCGNCGLLAQAQTEVDFRPVSAKERATGELRPPTPPAGHRSAPSALRCFVGQFPLPEEMERTTGATCTERTLAVLTTARACPRWLPYQAGLGPIAHLGSQWAQDQEREQRSFQHRLLDRSEQFQREQLALTQRTHRQLRGIAVSQALLSAVGILAALLIAAGGRGAEAPVSSLPVGQPTLASPTVGEVRAAAPLTPTVVLTEVPTPVPTEAPTPVPTTIPTLVPTEELSAIPTVEATLPSTVVRDEE